MATGTIKQKSNNSGSGYCKMPDGTLICWVSYQITSSISITSQWGGVYSTSNSIFFPNWPVQFIDIPMVAYGAQTDPYCWVHDAGSPSDSAKTAPVQIRLARGTSGTITGGYLYAIGFGRWK